MSPEETRIRVLLTKSGIDLHDRGVRYVAMKLRDAGMEVIYTQFGVVEEIATAAIEEDVDVVGLSSSTGGHIAVASRLMELLRAQGKEALVVVGGIVPDGDVPELQRIGVRGVFGPGSYAKEIVQHIRENVGKIG